MWRTKQLAGNHITADGCIGGYGIWIVDSTDMSYRYKSPGYPADYQMRVHDLNTVLINAKLVSNKSSKIKGGQMCPWLQQTQQAQRTAHKRIRLRSGMESRRTGKRIAAKVEQVAASDPLHILSYEIAQLNNGEHNAHSKSNPQSTFSKQQHRHRTHRLPSLLPIHGGISTPETVERPKAFHKLMK